MYFIPAISRCLLEGATNRALPSAYTLPCGLSLRLPFIHSFLPSIWSSSIVASSNLPGMTSTFCKPSTQLLLQHYSCQNCPRSLLSSPFYNFPCRCTITLCIIGNVPQHRQAPCLSIYMMYAGARSHLLERDIQMSRESRADEGQQAVLTQGIEKQSKCLIKECCSKTTCAQSYASELVQGLSALSVTLCNLCRALMMRARSTARRPKISAVMPGASGQPRFKRACHCSRTMQHPRIATHSTAGQADNLAMKPHSLALTSANPYCSHCTATTVASTTIARSLRTPR